ncbi:hypothetical protein [Planococcus salinus]|uniref:Uncharacterized protein n=1 Tax=Planococcus salinus TaxID=1848460 RepID=A0A3M8P6S5_9BACL|nr:hypothetical protein [Planococcus salinus]RNF39121.1 hypothetical protein EEX84_10475 [Planococcus salinus]
MESENRDEKIIKRYQQDERTMILLFIHWCTNHQLDPVSLYHRAYPAQAPNQALSEALEDAGQEEIDISSETLLEVLQMFGNDDLAFVVAEEAEKISR